MDNKETILKSRPNGHPVSLVKCTTDEGTVYYMLNDPLDSEEFDDEEEARLAYASAVTYWAKTPNWEAQARYDEQWGEPTYYNREY